MKSRRRLHYAYEVDDDGRLIGHAHAQTETRAEELARAQARHVMEMRRRKQAKADSIRDDAGTLPEGGVDLF